MAIYTMYDRGPGLFSLEPAPRALHHYIDVPVQQSPSLASRPRQAGAQLELFFQIVA